MDTCNHKMRRCFSFAANIYFLAIVPQLPLVPLGTILPKPCPSSRIRHIISLSSKSVALTRATGIISLSSQATTSHFITVLITSGKISFLPSIPRSRQAWLNNKETQFLSQKQIYGSGTAFRPFSSGLFLLRSPSGW